MIYHLQAPAKPKTPYGEMLQYYLKMEPTLFKSAVEDQLERLKEEKDKKEQARAQAEQNGKDSSELVLYQ